MSTLNWKDHVACPGSRARASREVGGEYRIVFRPSYTTWYGGVIADHYEVEYRRRARLDWNDIDYRGHPSTLAEAKRMAEEDHAERRQEVRANHAPA